MRTAVAIGINRYVHLASLSGCVDDAKAMAERLSHHANGDPNYTCDLLVSEHVKQREVRAAARKLLQQKGVDSAVFYFAGHGSKSETTATLLTAECEHGEEGFPMAELIGMANRSPAQEVLIMLDCCHAGAILDELTREGEIAIREGVSILAACRGTEVANEVDGRGIYTSRICEALDGGAADVRGFVTVASIYAYVCEVLDNWSSRPLLRTNQSKVTAIRRAISAIPDEKLRMLTELFPTPDHKFALGWRHEPTLEPRDEASEAQFSVLQRYRAARLLVPVDEEHMYYAARNNKACELTPLGKFYWRAVRAHKI